MTDTKPLVTSPPKLDEQKVREHFGKIEEGVNKQQGKKGYNPFMWLKEKVNPLVERFKDGERTAELEGQILSLPTEPPLPNNGKGVKYDEAPTQQDISKAPPAPGLKLNNRLL